MERHLHLFDTESEFNEVYNGSGYTDPWVSYIKETSGVTYNKIQQHDYSQDYLTFEILGNGNAESQKDDIYYSLDNGETWHEYGYSTSVEVHSGDKLMLKGDISDLGGRDGLVYIDCNFNMQGNIMSLINSTGFTTATTIPQGSSLGYLFGETGNEYLISAENLILPATALTEYCYQGMFSDCTSLTTAPVLPATTLAPYCYQNMFSNCTSLNYIKCLATDISASDCTSYWVYNVASTGTFVKNPNMSSWTTGDDGIPEGWTVEDAS